MQNPDNERLTPKGQIISVTCPHADSEFRSRKRYNKVIIEKMKTSQLLISIFLLIVPLLGSAQNSGTCDTLNVTDSIGKKQGKWYFYYDGTGCLIKKVETYKDGALNGEYKSFYRSGKVEFEGFFINGEKDGLSLYYYENGIISGYYYSKDGKTVLSAVCNEIGEIDTQIVYNNGLPAHILHYKKGLLKANSELL